jgi:hypothetical protein
MTDQTSKVQIWSINKRKTTARHRIMDDAPKSKNTTPEISKENQIRTRESATSKHHTGISIENQIRTRESATINIREPPTNNRAHEGKGKWETHRLEEEHPQAYRRLWQGMRLGEP